MPTADTNRVDLRHATESTWGETPASVPTTQVRYTSESLRHAKQTVISQEIRTDRQRTALLEVGVTAQGTTNHELHYGDLEAFFESSMKGTITSTVISDSSVTFAASTIQFPSTFSLTVANFVADQWIRVTGAAAAANNRVVQIAVVSAADTTLTVTGGSVGTSEVSSAIVNGRGLRNGTDNTKSFLLEKVFGDIGESFYFNGMKSAGGSLNAAAQQVITNAFEWVGKQGFAASVSITSTITSASNNLPMTAAVHLGTLRENDATLGTSIQSLSLQWANNLRPVTVIGQKGANEIAAGGVDISGTLRAYFEDLTLINKFIDHTSSNLSFRFTDDSDNVIVVTIPEIYYSDGNPQATGQDADVFLDLNFTGVRDGTNDYSLQFDFLPATP